MHQQQRFNEGWSGFFCWKKAEAAHAKLRQSGAGCDNMCGRGLA